MLRPTETQAFIEIETERLTQPSKNPNALKTVKGIAFRYSDGTWSTWQFGIDALVFHHAPLWFDPDEDVEIETPEDEAPEFE